MRPFSTAIVLILPARPRAGSNGASDPLYQSPEHYDGPCSEFGDSPTKTEAPGANTESTSPENKSSAPAPKPKKKKKKKRVPTTGVTGESQARRDGAVARAEAKIETLTYFLDEGLLSKDNAAKLGRDLDHLSDSELKDDQRDYLIRRDEMIPLLGELAIVPLPTNPKSSEVKAVKDKLKEITTYVQKGGVKPSLEEAPAESPVELAPSTPTSVGPKLVATPSAPKSPAKTIALGQPEATAKELLNHYEPADLAKLVSCLNQALEELPAAA